MGARTAEEAVYELLGEPTRPRRSWTADLETVELLKQRDVHGCRLYVVAFEADDRRRGHVPMTMLVRADRQASTWNARRVTGVSGPGETRPAEPRIGLGGSWGRHGFCGGGRVDAAGADVARVRIRFTNGVEVEDDARTGWVLFLTDEPVERPDAEVELLDSNGEVVARFDWPWTPDLPELLRRRIGRT